MHVRDNTVIRVEELEEEVADGRAVWVAADDNVFGGAVVRASVRRDEPPQLEESRRLIRHEEHECHD